MSFHMSIHPFVRPDTLHFEYLVGEVRASIVVGQLHVLLTLMNLKMPSDLRKGIRPKERQHKSCRSL